MQKLEQTHRLCADGSSAGSDALAAREAAWPGGTRPAPVHSQRGSGPRSLLWPKNKTEQKKPHTHTICSNRGEPVSTEWFFSRALHFSGYLAAVSEIAFSDPAWGNPWHCLALSAGSVLFHSVPQELSKLTQTGSVPFLSPGREVCAQPESLKQVFTHVLVREMLEM